MYFDQIAKGKTEEEALYFCEGEIYKKGVMATKIAAITGRSLSAAAAQTGGRAIAAGGFVSPVSWAFAGILLTAQTATDHKKVKAGLMTKEQFNLNLKTNSIASAGGIVGSSGGAMTGFLIGSAICPGVGSAVGTFAGAMVGGIMGAKYSKKALKTMDDRVAQIHAIKDQAKKV